MTLNYKKKILLLTNVDFHLSNDKRQIKSINRYPDKQILEDIPLNEDQDLSEYRLQTMNCSRQITSHQNFIILQTT